MDALPDFPRSPAANQTQRPPFRLAGAALTGRWLPALAVAAVLAACGGGGDSSSLGGQEPLSSSVARPKADAKVPALVAQEVMLVNTTTAGDQTLRSVGALADGGYGVAWRSGDAFYFQRYDSAGAKVGGETLIQLSVQADNPSAVYGGASLAVLSDGTVTVTYPANRSTTLPPNGLVSTKSGVYFQRFDASGQPIGGEVEVASRVHVINSRSPNYGALPTLALPDGSFVVAWIDISPSSVGIRATIRNQRYDASGQPVGGTLVVGQANANLAPNTYSAVADAEGGYTVTLHQQNEQFQTEVAVYHFDAAQAVQQIVAPTSGDVVVLALEGEQYLLFASNAQGAYRQLLDSQGQPVGAATPITAIPLLARELADGSYVTLSAEGGGHVIQRYDAQGNPLGQPLPVQAGTGTPMIAVLENSGFALAWSAAGAGSDLDVFTQRFIEVLDSKQKADRAKRKACQESAKAQGLKGQERKAFMNGCLAA